MSKAFESFCLIFDVRIARAVVLLVVIGVGVEGDRGPQVLVVYVLILYDCGIHQLF